MSSIKVELNLRGINEMMMSPEIEAALQQAGEAVARRAEGMAGEKFGARTHKANWVSITNVYPDDKKAASANYEDNTLLHAVGDVGLPTKKG